MIEQRKNLDLIASAARVAASRDMEQTIKQSRRVRSMDDVEVQSESDGTYCSESHDEDEEEEDDDNQHTPVKHH
jgi:hypothetical protein